jgi:6-phosphogluconolactonase
MKHCFPSTVELADKLSREFLDFISGSRHLPGKMNIALSGGTTPREFFEHITVNQHKCKTPVLWDKVHLFWVDERCVPPDHTESNYGMARSALLGKIPLHEGNIHRIRGEDEPASEAVRYSREVKGSVSLKEGIPVFDWIFLGLGNDGHTASLFPDRTDLLDTENIYDTVVHPGTGKRRITLTGRSILHAKKITFLVTGRSKRTIVRQIIHHEPVASRYPAAYLYFNRKDAEWYLDSDAAEYL